MFFVTYCSTRNVTIKIHNYSPHKEFVDSFIVAYEDRDWNVTVSARINEKLTDKLVFGTAGDV